MASEPRRTIESLLASKDPENLRTGLQLVKEEVARVGCEEAKPLFAMVSTLFYIDPLDHPDLRPLLDEAITLVVGFGDCVIPALVQNLDDGDLKAQLAVAHALGRFGADAITPLIAEYEAATDIAVRTFVLYALGHINSPKIAQVIPLALEAADANDRGLRDTAARALGRFADAIPPEELAEETRLEIVTKLRDCLADPNPGIRAKAVRSLGKLARNGFLEPPELEELRATLELLLGTDDHFEWDRAYVVRKEAEEALAYLD